MTLVYFATCLLLVATAFGTMRPSAIYRQLHQVAPPIPRDCPPWALPVLNAYRSSRRTATAAASLLFGVLASALFYRARSLTGYGWGTLSLVWIVAGLIAIRFAVAAGAVGYRTARQRNGTSPSAFDRADTMMSAVALATSVVVLYLGLTLMLLSLLGA